MCYILLINITGNMIICRVCLIRIHRYVKYKAKSLTYSHENLLTGYSHQIYHLKATANLDTNIANLFNIAPYKSLRTKAIYFHCSKIKSDNNYLCLSYEKYQA